MFGLLFKGFYVSGVADPSVFNGHKFYNVTLSDGHQDYPVSVGQDGRGEVICNSFVVFDKLYDGSLIFRNGKLVLDHYEDSSAKDPVQGLSFENLRVSSINDYVYENEDGIKYYSANFSDGRQAFKISLGADQAGKKLLDSLVVRTVVYKGTLSYLDIKRKSGDVKLLCVTSLVPVSPVKK